MRVAPEVSWVATVSCDVPPVEVLVLVDVVLVAVAEVVVVVVTEAVVVVREVLVVVVDVALVVVVVVVVVVVEEVVVVVDGAGSSAATKSPKYGGNVFQGFGMVPLLM